MPFPVVDVAAWYLPRASMRLVHTRVFPSLFEIVVYFCIQYKRRPHFFVDAQFCFLVIFNSYVIQFGCMSPFVNRGKLVNFFTIFPEAFYHGVPSLGVYHITLSFPPCLFAIKKKTPSTEEESASCQLTSTFICLLGKCYVVGSQFRYFSPGSLQALLVK